VAKKVLPKREQKNPLITSEVDIVRSLGHPNVIKLFHIIETTENISLILEYVSGGDCWTVLEEEEGHL
jgi:MAP/microtubule affinity-regulating kinase